MSNASIASRLLAVLAKVELHQLSLVELDNAVMAAVGAFEALPAITTHRLRELPAEALQQSVSPFESELLGIAHSNEALVELRTMLEAIACAQQGVQRDGSAAR